MSVELIVQKATAGIVRYLGARGILQLPAGPVGEAIKFDIDDFIESAVRAAVKERGEDTKILDAYKAWADKATTQLCGDEPLDRSQLIKEWEAIEPENAEDDSLQQQSGGIHCPT